MSSPVSDPCDREAAWLNTLGDALPQLPAPAGPWQVIQAYWPGPKLDVNKTGIYVCPARDIDRRSGGVRIMPRFAFRLEFVWPIKNVIGSAGQGLAETEQRNFRAAGLLVMQRVRGPVLNKTHGGRFLSVGETPSGQPPQIDWVPASQTIDALRSLRGFATYYADDFEVSG